MQDSALVPEGPQLNQFARVGDTFVAPSKTFTDILRSASCWLPVVLTILLTVGWAATIDRTVGFETATAVQMAKNPAQEERMQQNPGSMAMAVKITRITSYLAFVFVIIIFLIETLIFWGAFNFGLGASTKFSQVFAVVAFAGLPRALITVISIILLCAGVGTDNFDQRNPVGTNLGFYLTSAPKWMSTAGSFFDIFGFWSLALLVIGMAIISKKKISQSAIIIVGLWALILLISTGVSAATS